MDEKTKGLSPLYGIELLSQRAEMYKVLAQLYFRPLSSEQVNALSEQDWESLAEDGSAAADACNDIYRALRRMNTGTADDLAADFTAVFYGASTHDGKTAQPYASLFMHDGNQIMGEACSEAYHAFKSECIRVAQGIDMPDDHLSFMFEFMAKLCERAKLCVDASDESEAVRIVSLQRTFLEKQVTPWVNDFLDLALSMVATRFYRGVIKLTGAFLNEEKQLLEEVG